MAGFCPPSHRFARGGNNSVWYDLDGAEMLGLIGPQNHKLTRELLQAKDGWETLLADYRANARGGFFYRTTLARVVAHVTARAQDEYVDDDDVDDGQISELAAVARDITQWERECHPSPRDGATKTGTGGGGVAGGSSRSDVSLSTPHRPPPRRLLPPDYEDVRPLLRSESASSFPSSSSSSSSSSRGRPLIQNAVSERNRSLREEIVQWEKSAERIQAATPGVVLELLTHQRTLRRVVDRIRRIDDTAEASSSSTTTTTATRTATPAPRDLVEDVLRWYEECQREAERCGSFTEEAAADYLRRGSSDDPSSSNDTKNGNGGTVEAERKFVKDGIPDDEQSIPATLSTSMEDADVCDVDLPIKRGGTGTGTTGQPDTREWNPPRQPSSSHSQSQSTLVVGQDQGKCLACAVM
jgi:hypothetical protein